RDEDPTAVVGALAMWRELSGSAIIFLLPCCRLKGKRPVSSFALTARLYFTETARAITCSLIASKQPTSANAQNNETAIE
ncbi:MULTISPECIES: hypothetical protein, partial [Sinorhizobium]|uniref:hypothetical protein n=1 Tax=Sinorhizobium TaxID=28105 RepID=UPI000BEE428A